MFATVVVLSAFLSLVLMPLGVFKLINHPMATEAAERLGLKPNHSRAIGILEISGAAGLLIGLTWAPLGVAAAGCLILLLLGAAATHFRVHDPLKVAAFPVFLAILSAVTLILRIKTA
ncbi:MULTISPECIES: DoxX family protein [Streptomyces]|uniref:DoxX family protein n=2 Tax=Streptomyces TaxID=1883 RepID=A0ABV9IT41_9ACTN